MKNKKLLLASIILIPTSIMAASPYSNSFEKYSKEFKDDKIMSDSFLNYQKEVDNIEKRNGYIGKALDIPKLKKVKDDVYTITGSLIWGNRGNYGFNNNMSAVIFKDGVFVYNAGPNEPVAYSFHQQLKKITNKPVKWVAIENHQGHANMGASYWYDIGVKNIYSQKEATEHFNENFDKLKTRYIASSGAVINQHSKNVSDKYTKFDKSLSIDVGGGENVLLINFGGGHTPTMTGAAIGSKQLIFAGDLGFNERLPGLFGDDGNYQEWIKSFNKMKGAASFISKQPELVTVIPGHGTPTTIKVLEEKTINYFLDVENEVIDVINKGGGVREARKVDQSKYKDRAVFEQLAEDNAESIYNTLIKGD